MLRRDELKLKTKMNLTRIAICYCVRECVDVLGQVDRYYNVIMIRYCTVYHIHWRDQNGDGGGNGAVE